MLAERLRQLREERGFSQESVAKRINISRAAYGFYEAGKRDIGTVALQTLADLYDCSVDYILGITDVRKRSLRVNATNCVPIPVVGVIRAGTPVLATENTEGYVLVTREEAENGDFFYLRVAGDSMTNARIADGDLVYVRQQNDVDNRDIAVVMVDGENATIKRVLKTADGIILQPESPNTAHIPLFYHRGEGDFKIIGKVLHVKFKVGG